MQLDQVLGALNSDTRQNLQDFLVYYGDALTRKPSPAENARQDAEVHGLNAAQALNLAYQRGPGSLKGSAIINQAITGTEPHDLSKLVAGIGRVTAALNGWVRMLGDRTQPLGVLDEALAGALAALSQPDRGLGSHV